MRNVKVLEIINVYCTFHFNQHTFWDFEIPRILSPLCCSNPSCISFTKGDIIENDSSIHQSFSMYGEEKKKKKNQSWGQSLTFCLTSFCGSSLERNKACGTALGSELLVNYSLKMINFWKKKKLTQDWMTSRSNCF